MIYRSPLQWIDDIRVRHTHLLSASQVEFLGSQWGTQSVYKYYKNDEDPSKSDAIFYFSNTSPAIPSGDSSLLIVPLIHFVAAWNCLLSAVFIESDDRMHLIMGVPCAQLRQVNH